MEQNNFKQLFEQEEETYEKNHQRHIASKVWGTLGLFRLVGDIVEIFIPRVMEVFVMAAGGRNDNADRSRGGTAPNDLKGGGDPGKIGPKAPEDMDN